MDIWCILGLTSTSNADTIRKAYAERVKDCHPEDRPQEFQQLYDAYRKAMTLARISQRTHRALNKDGMPVAVLSYDQTDMSTVNFFEAKAESGGYDFSSLPASSYEELELYEAQCRENVLANIKLLLKHKTSRSKWKPLLQSESFYYVMETPQFVGELAKLLGQCLRRMKPAVCEEIMRVYFSSGQRDPNISPYRQLSEILSKRKSKTKEQYYKIKLKLQGYLYR